MTTIEIISKEQIKPSSPTPQNLKSYNLSVLDQLVPAPYASVVLYYPNQPDLDVQKLLTSLKTSLSETLTRFYPLAGTVKSDFLIDCNDVGAYFAVARVNTRLDEFLNQPDIDLINHFLPYETSFHGSSEGSCVSNVQVTIFECSGLAISLCTLHKILDGGALSTFIRSWAGSTNGSKEVIYPDMRTSSLFPAKDLRLKDSAGAMWGSIFKMGKCKTTRFVFDTTKIALLRTKVVENGLKDPTRVEVVSGLLWKCFMAVIEGKTGSLKTTLLSHVVNLRRRLTPTLSENSFGNLIFFASAECEEGSRAPLHDLAEKVRGGVSKINGEFVKKMQGDKGVEVMQEGLKSIEECVNYLGFSSWCKMRYYEADFGFGKPIWMSSGIFDGNPVYVDFVILNDTPNGDGIEAWVTLDEDEMHVLKHDPELLKFASVDPSPLQM